MERGEMDEITIQLVPASTISHNFQSVMQQMSSSLYHYDNKFFQHFILCHASILCRTFCFMCHLFCVSACPHCAAVCFPVEYVDEVIYVQVVLSQNTTKPNKKRILVILWIVSPNIMTTFSKLFFPEMILNLFTYIFFSQTLSQASISSISMLDVRIHIELQLCIYGCFSILFHNQISAWNSWNS